MAIKGKEETWREFSSYPHSFCSGPGRDRQREEPGTREPTTPAWLRGEKQRRDTELMPNEGIPPRKCIIRDNELYRTGPTCCVMWYG